MPQVSDKNLARIHRGLPRLLRELRHGRLGRREFVRLATLLGLGAGAAFGLAGARGQDRPAPRRGVTRRPGGTLRFSMRIPDLGRPHTFSWGYDSNVVRQVNDYLTRTGPDNVTRPWLLAGWRASGDLKTWTLKLRRGVRWSNGDELVADHVIWNLRRWLDPETGSSMLGLMQGYMLAEDAGGTRIWSENAIEKLDDHTLRLNLKTPQVAVPEHLFHYPALILHPSEGGKWGVGAIGTGAFSIEEISVGRGAVLVRRPGYWRHGPHLDRVEFIDHGDEASAALAALASRQVHGLYEGSVTQYAALKALGHTRLHVIDTSQTAVARMQVTRKPFDDARVRKAMRLALDTEKLLRIGHIGLGAPGEHHHVSPIHPEYYKLPFMRRDVGRAKALLAEAGYAKGFDTEIACQKDPAWELITVQAMVEMWKAIGVRVRINVMPSTQYWEVWTKVPFGFTRWTARPLAIMLLPLAYRTGVPWNESRFSSPRLDELMTRAEGTLDIDERRAIMREIEELMQEEGPIAQPLWRAVFTAVDRRVEGFRIHPSLYLFAEEWSLGE